MVCLSEKEASQRIFNPFLNHLYCSTVKVPFHHVWSAHLTFILRRQSAIQQKSPWLQSRPPDQHLSCLPSRRSKVHSWLRWAQRLMWCRQLLIESKLWMLRSALRRSECMQSLNILENYLKISLRFPSKLYQQSSYLWLRWYSLIFWDLSISSNS